MRGFKFNIIIIKKNNNEVVNGQLESKGNWNRNLSLATKFPTSPQ